MEAHEISKSLNVFKLCCKTYVSEQKTFESLAVESTVIENENGIETERQKTTAEILAEYDSKVNLVDDKVCITRHNGKTECFTGINDLKICDGDDCYSETIPCEVCFLSGE